MHKRKLLTISLILVIALILAGLSFNVSARPLAATSPTLGAVDSFAVLAGTTVANTGPTNVYGDLGVSPGTSITNFPPGIVHLPGTIRTTGDSALAQLANTAAFLALSAAPNVFCDGHDWTGTGTIELATMSLIPGVYCADNFNLNGTLTLNDTGAPDGVWIFRTTSAAASLVTTPGVGARVQFLTGVGSACNVWWRVASSATIGVGTSFIGNILALTSISMGTNASLTGRVLAQTGAITLDSNTINRPVCAAQLTQTAVAATLTAVPTNTATRTPTSIPTSTPRPAVLPGTGFSPNGVTVLSNQSADKAYTAVGDLWLEVPKLGVQMNIVGVPETAGTWDVSWLGKQAGWLQGSAFPTWTGNSVLTGHVWNADNTVGPFRYINTLWWGDKVIVHAWGAKYVYEVRSVTQVGPGNTAAMMKHETLPWITLVTCRGYDQASNSYKYRVLVRAVLIEVK